MADTKDESEVIKLLLNFEKEASLIVDEAVEKAEKDISDAKIAANAEYQKKYETLVQQLETEYTVKVSEIEKNHEQIINEYKSSLESKNRNKQAFFSFVDSVFFKTDTNK